MISMLARADLSDAIQYAVAGGHRIYEVDVRVGLAWMYLAEGNADAARAEAEHAQRLSSELGYQWGRVDASTVLDGLRR
jgi:hypothetical protein